MWTCTTAGEHGGEVQIRKGAYRRNIQETRTLWLRQSIWVGKINVTHWPMLVLCRWYELRNRFFHYLARRETIKKHVIMSHLVVLCDSVTWRISALEIFTTCERRSYCNTKLLAIKSFHLADIPTFRWSAMDWTFLDNATSLIQKSLSGELPRSNRLLIMLGGFLLSAHPWTCLASHQRHQGKRF